MSDKDGKSRGPPRSVSDNHILDTLTSRINETGRPVVSTVEIANIIEPISQQQIRNRLSQLEESGKVCSLRVGSAYVWWPSLDSPLTVYYEGTTGSNAYLEDIPDDLVQEILESHLHPEDVPRDLVQRLVTYYRFEIFD